eukprot:2907728-Rhodomonas_salina.1
MPWRTKNPKENANKGGGGGEKRKRKNIPLVALGGGAVGDIGVRASLIGVVVLGRSLVQTQPAISTGHALPSASGEPVQYWTCSSEKVGRIPCQYWTIRS